jgi:hypothetical protein
VPEITYRIHMQLLVLGPCRIIISISSKCQKLLTEYILPVLLPYVLNNFEFRIGTFTMAVTSTKSTVLLRLSTSQKIIATYKYKYVQQNATSTSTHSRTLQVHTAVIYVTHEYYSCCTAVPHFHCHPKSANWTSPMHIFD